MSGAAIQIEGLTKVYQGEIGKPRVTGLKDLNCVVNAGEVYAFLGPNGAGKTTAIKCMTRLLRPTRGRIQILGRDGRRRETMNRVGYLPEQPNLYGYLTGREFLDFIARLFSLSAKWRKQRIDSLMHRVGMADKASMLIRNYSRGMMQRLGLAQALINDPDVLILDEPMASLDPVGRKDFRDLILECKKEGKTVFFSSHILSDAELIADRVGIIKDGHLLREGNLHELISGQITSVEVTFQVDEIRLKALSVPAGNMIRQDPNIMIRLPGLDAVPGILEQIGQCGGRIISVIPQKKSLESYFMDELRR